MRLPLIFLAGLISLCWLGACKSKPAAQGLVPLTVVDDNGSAAIRFGRWVLVFEGVSSKNVSIGSTGTINFPDPNGAGGSEASFGALKIKQSWDGHANSIDVNGCAFTLSRDDGSKLAFADHTYRVSTGQKTIVIAKDGKTHEREK